MVGGCLYWCGGGGECLLLSFHCLLHLFASFLRPFVAAQLIFFFLPFFFFREVDRFFELGLFVAAALVHVFQTPCSPVPCSCSGVWSDIGAVVGMGSFLSGCQGHYCRCCFLEATNLSAASPILSRFFRQGQSPMQHGDHTHIHTNLHFRSPNVCSATHMARCLPYLCCCAGVFAFVCAVAAVVDVFVKRARSIVSVLGEGDHRGRSRAQTQTRHKPKPKPNTSFTFHSADLPRASLFFTHRASEISLFFTAPQPQP